MLYLTCTMISSVDLAHYGVSRAKDWVSGDSGRSHIGEYGYVEKEVKSERLSPMEPHLCYLLQQDLRQPSYCTTVESCQLKNPYLHCTARQCSPLRRKFSECSINNPALSLLMKHLVIGQRQKAPNFSAFHWSPRGNLVSIGQHFVITRVVHVTEKDRNKLNYRIGPIR